MEEAIEILINHGQSVHELYVLKELDSKNKGWTPFICACIQSKTNAGKKLLDLGANPLDCNEYGISVLDICKKLNNDELVKYIEEKIVLSSKTL